MKERKAENRPVVRPGAVGWILEGAALLVLLADFSFTAWGTFALPEMPPEFFEFRGGGSMASLRAGLWVLPAVALLSYLLLTWLTSIPHRLPYPRPVTDDNRQRLYTTATRMLRVLKLLSSYCTLMRATTGSPRLSVCRSWMSIRCMRWRWLSW